MAPHLPGRLHYAEKVERLIRHDPQIVFAYDASNIENGPARKVIEHVARQIEDEDG